MRQAGKQGMAACKAPPGLAKCFQFFEASALKMNSSFTIALFHGVRSHIIAPLVQHGADFSPSRCAQDNVQC